MQLPSEIKFNQVKIILQGNNQFYIENHQGIIQYQPQQVLIAYQGGRVSIEGESLIIAMITDEEIYLQGIIRQVRYEI